MKRFLNMFLSIVVLAIVFTSCDWLFPYSLEDAPAPTAKPNPEPNPDPNPDPNPVDGFVFSIDYKKYVCLSPGNLQYNANLKQWRFAPNQYDYIGDANEFISSYYAGWIDLFGWGTGNNPTEYSTSENDYSLYIDWGFNKIGDDEPETWRTLTSGEWKYMLNSRINAVSLRGAACLLLENGGEIIGWILLPDNWETPTGITFKSGCSNGYSTNVIREEKWKLMEKNGAVFLPAAGYRNGYTVYDVKVSGRYWTSSASYEYNYKGAPLWLKFTSEIIDPTYKYTVSKDYRHFGHSVRLAKDVVL